MTQAAAAQSALQLWTARRRRAGQLLERYRFAHQMLAFYSALLDTQERVFLAALESPPDPAHLAAYAADRLLPDVVALTVADGPAALREASVERLAAGNLSALVSSWLIGERQSAVDAYLARAATGPLLEALGSDASLACSGPRDAGRCPRCGGRPQLSYFTDTGEPLTTGPRCLLCSRCGHSWIFDRMTCPGCGERSTAKQPIYAESERFPHMRVDACESCRRYLMTLDFRKDSEAVPVVDELAGLPLDLYVQERGFTKIVPNLMGIG